MNRVVVHTRVESDGFVRVEVPVSQSDVDLEVQVTIEAVEPATSRNEWEQFIRRTAGTIPDQTFVRHSQGDYESRELIP